MLTHHPAGKQARTTHTFLLKRGLSGEPGTLSLEMASRPGTYLATYVPKDIWSHECYGGACKLGACFGGLQDSHRAQRFEV